MHRRLGLAVRDQVRTWEQGEFVRLEADELDHAYESHVEEREHHDEASSFGIAARKVLVASADGLLGTHRL
jgi:hypothetical protein